MLPYLVVCETDNNLTISHLALFLVDSNIVYSPERASLY